ncbi:ROK family protein [Isoptericola sp. BMS4]|uniref:ROK family protein n=1 Tax=Isoptericola sp. BMS4 TaxID=2527875 RepID=UPI001423B851|nr:ROK family protein [Isoptericola sp. BMS4]
MDTPPAAPTPASPDHHQEAPATRPDPGAAEDHALGVDVARDRVRVALVDATGALRARAERRDVPTAPPARARAVAGLARAASEDVEARLDGGRRVRLRHAVVGVPSVVAPDHASLRRVPGYEKGGTGLRDALVDALGCPVDVENDVNLAALAEVHHGAGRDARSVVTLVLGTGFGAGIVLDGRVHRGHAGLAGEVDFLPQPGLALGSPVLGETALAALAKEHGLSPSSTVGGIVDRTEAGDATAAEVLDVIAHRVAVSAASLALVLDPELFVLGDQAARPALHDRVARYLREQIAVLPVRVAASPLGADGVVLGAAHLAGEALR